MLSKNSEKTWKAWSASCHDQSATNSRQMIDGQNVNNEYLEEEETFRRLHDVVLARATAFTMINGGLCLKCSPDNQARTSLEDENRLLIPFKGIIVLT